jgi:2-hydroxy-6-oxonona-2,4-dienedioate hydrolase
MPAIDPPGIVARLDAASRCVATPCGAGTMVWRSWGAGKPLVLLHGGYGSWTHWLRNIEALAAEWNVIAPDLPGLGDSAMPPDPIAPESLADIIAGGLATVLDGSGPAALVGFSFGGLLSGHVAARHGALVRSLILVGPGGLGPPRAPVAPLQRAPTGSARDERAAVQRRNLAILMLADPAKIDALAVHLQLENVARGRIRSPRMGRTDTLRRVLPAIRCRIGAIWGEKDVTLGPNFAQRRELIRAVHPEARVATIPEAGHWVQYEAAEAFNALLGNWLTPEG